MPLYLSECALHSTRIKAISSLPRLQCNKPSELEASSATSQKSDCASSPHQPSLMAHGLDTRLSPQEGSKYSRDCCAAHSHKTHFPHPSSPRTLHPPPLRFGSAIQKSDT